MRKLISAALLAAGLSACSTAPTMYEDANGYQKPANGSVNQLVDVSELLSNPKAYKGKNLAVKGVPYSVASANYQVPTIPSPHTNYNAMTREQAEFQRNLRKSYIDKNMDQRTWQYMTKGDSPKVAIAKATQDTQIGLMNAELTGLVASQAIVGILDSIDTTLYNLEPDQLSIVIGNPKLPNKKLLCRASKSHPAILARVGNEIAEGDEVVIAGYFDGNVLTMHQIYTDKRDPSRGEK